MSTIKKILNTWSVTFWHKIKPKHKSLENLVKSGKAGQEHKARLRKAYIREKQSEEGFEQYLAAMEAEAQKNAYEAILKKLVNAKTPNFQIKDLSGKTVSLKSLQGKIVIMDFWATWCGPCLASFPGMKEAVNQYKDDKEVAFLFVATWDRKDEVVKWAEKNKDKYPFYILYDDNNKLAQDFGIEGLPTKFILGKKGETRYISVGASSSPEATRSEIQNIVEALKKQ